MTVRIEKPSLNLREELAKGTDNTLDKAVWGDLTVNGSVTADDTYVGREGGYDGTAGIHLQNDGFIGASRDSFHVATLNRNTSDGDIAIFRKNNATVGSIGTESNAFTIDGGGGYAGLYIGINSVLARNSGALADGSKDIGNASYRWKDLYLSGGVYLGGTGAANHLDDYEEGTHTATISPTTSGTITLNSTNNVLAYTKVGRVVHITGDLVIGSVSSPVGTSVEISLPFAINNTTGLSGRIGGAFRYYDASVGDSTITFRGFEGDSVVKATINSSTLASSDSITVSFTYYTTA